MFGISSDIDDDANAGTFGTTKRSSSKSIRQQSQAKQQVKQTQQQMIDKTVLEFNSLKKQLMQQQGLSEEEIRNIAKEAGQGISKNFDRLIAGNEALKKKLKGELVND